MAITYPNALDVLTNPTSTDTLNSPSHSDQHANINDAVEALEAKVGITSSADTDSIDYKINVDGGVVGVTETQTLTNKTISTGCTIDANVTVTEVLKKAYPIGSIYINAGVATNPATLMGFGTWEIFGAGKMVVGINSADTDFDALSDTGGNKTVTLAQANLPNISTGAGTAHTHTQAAHNHTQDAHVHGVRYKQFTGLSAGTGWYLGRRTDGGDSYDGTDADAANSTTATNQAATATNNNESSHTHSLGGSATAINIMNPYITAYLWKRTA